MTRSPSTRLAAACALGVALAAPAVVAAMDREEILDRLHRQEALLNAPPSDAPSDPRGVGVSFGSDAASGEARSAAAAPAERGDAATRPVSLAAPPDLPDDVDVDLRITFETNSAFIRPGQRGLLAELCAALDAAPEDWRFNIIGHADAAGEALHNLRLSEARAREVVRYLNAECGLAASRLRPVGLGETRLVPGAPPVSEVNRRVEVQVAREG